MTSDRASRETATMPARTFRLRTWSTPLTIGSFALMRSKNLGMSLLFKIPKSHD